MINRIQTILLKGLLVLALGHVAILKAELMPGDFVVTELTPDKITLVALTEFVDESLTITDKRWVDGAFVADSGEETLVSLTTVEGEASFSPGQQTRIGLGPVSFEFGDTLHFYQRVPVPGDNQFRVRHLLMLEANEQGLRWHPTPFGLEPDVTHLIVAPLEGQDDPVINHIINREFQGGTPFQWCRRLALDEAWQDRGKVDGGTDDFPFITLPVFPSRGRITLPFGALPVDESDPQTFVPVWRQFATGGSASVCIDLQTESEPLTRFQSARVEGRYPDLTGLVHAPKFGFVAVGPESPDVFINEGAGWKARPINGTDEDLALTDIVFDGTDFFACARDGAIYASRDAIQWTEVLNLANDLRMDAELYGMAFLPGAYAAFGTNGILVTSQSGGRGTWENIDTGTSATLYDLASNGTNLLLVGESGTLRYTEQPSPAGRWRSLPSDSDEDLFAVTTFSKGGFYICGSQGTVLFVDGQKGLSPAALVSAGTEADLIEITEAVVSSPSGPRCFVVALGGQGTLSIAEPPGNFVEQHSFNRGEALIAAATDQGPDDSFGTEMKAVGEYGTFIEIAMNAAPLSGGGANLKIATPAGENKLSWPVAKRANAEQFAELQASSIPPGGAQVNAVLERPANAEPYRIGRATAPLRLFSAGSNARANLRENFGAFVEFAEADLRVSTPGTWRLSFHLINRSGIPSLPLFLRFDGTSRPDYFLDHDLPGGVVPANSTVGPLTVFLERPVERISLFEVTQLDSNGDPLEVRFKVSDSFNSLAIDPRYQPNGIFPATFGLPTSIVGDLLGLSRNLLPALIPNEKDGPRRRGHSRAGFGSDVPPRPGGVPDYGAYILFNASTEGLASLPAREVFDYFMIGEFYHSSSGTTDEFDLSEVVWSLTEGGLPPVGLSVESDGTVEGIVYPSLALPRHLTLEGSSSEGASTDSEGKLLVYTDTLAFSLVSASTDVSYAEWVATETTLSGDEDGQEQDPEADDLVNLIEFGFDLDPEIADALKTVENAYDSDTGIYTFRFTIPRNREGVRYEIETTPDLTAEPVVWTSQSLTLLSTTSDSETWGATVSLGETGYGRLRLTSY
ncbi:MAG: WD40/YVTN/BNR-like repeat-containing protein [Opitutales bacterium]